MTIASSDPTAGEPVRVGRFEWERLMMLSDLDLETVKLRLLVVATYMNADGSSARPGNANLAELLECSEQTCKRLLNAAVGAGYLILVRRGGSRKGPGGARVSRASDYAASVPAEVHERRAEVLHSSPYGRRAAAHEGDIPGVTFKAAGTNVTSEPYEGDTRDVTFNETGASTKVTPESTKVTSRPYEGDIQGVTPPRTSPPRNIHHPPTPTGHATDDHGLGPQKTGGGDPLRGKNSNAPGASVEATELLASLPPEWAHGKETARNAAPLVAEALAGTWTPDTLTAYLTAPLPGNAAVQHPGALLISRLRDLPPHPPVASVQPLKPTYSPRCDDSRHDHDAPQTDRWLYDERFRPTGKCECANPINVEGIAS